MTRTVSSSVATGYSLPATSIDNLMFLDRILNDLDTTPTLHDLTLHGPRIS